MFYEKRQLYFKGANFKTIGFFLLITLFELCQNHFDAAHTLLFFKNRKNQIFCQYTSVPFFTA